MPILEKQPPLSPGPVGFLLGCFFTVSQPNRILRGNLEYFKNLLNPVGFIYLGVFLSISVESRLEDFQAEDIEKDVTARGAYLLLCKAVPFGV